MQTQEETLFYKDHNVTVTQSRYVTNSKTYAMRNISSVHVFEIVKNHTLPVVLIIVGAIMLITDGGKVIGGIIALIGFLVIIFNKNQYAVRISTNSGEANSIVSRDKIYIQKIVDALNDAIIHRG
ncbi:DUF6232 family protein [Pedobacter chitinilyticus]|uniref:QacE n=1 Tax=Pedobacter chitinilyticus TaxID=2233776 RepID=A0A3S3R4M2_9SPHI|nr:DUF6232 family protein [Pedobacter chitinilyticus]RWU04878.1 hypothetical protein DPV69_17090 [Pedobacter chitinilyticus]